MKISFVTALASGSQASIFRINPRNCSFSSPGGITVTKSSSEVSGIGASDNVQLPTTRSNLEFNLLSTRDKNGRLEDDIPFSSKYSENKGLFSSICSGGGPRYPMYCARASGRTYWLLTRSIGSNRFLPSMSSSVYSHIFWLALLSLYSIL